MESQEVSLSPESSSPPTINGDQILTNQEVVSESIVANFERLIIGVAVLVAKAGLAESAVDKGDITNEIFQNTAETALRSVQNYKPNHSVHAWFLGIAANKIKEFRRRLAYQAKKTQSIENGDNQEFGGDSNSAGDGLDWTAEEQLDAIIYHSSQRDLLNNTSHTLDELLSLVNENDREILTLAYVDQMDGVEIAAKYGIREGAAYMRIARAKEHLRQNYLSAGGLTRKDY